MSCRPETAADQIQGNTAEDTLVYLLPCADLAQLREQHPGFAEHFEQSVTSRLRRAISDMVNAPAAGTGLMTVRVGKLVNRSPVSTDSGDQHPRGGADHVRAPGLLAPDHGRRAPGRDHHRPRPAQPLRGRRAVTDRPVREIMTERLRRSTWIRWASRPWWQMTRLNVHHLPVVEEGQVAGILSTTDLTRFQSANAVYLVGPTSTAPRWRRWPRSGPSCRSSRSIWSASGPPPTMWARPSPRSPTPSPCASSRWPRRSWGHRRCPTPGWWAAPRRAGSSRPTPIRTTRC
jgi:CBS domain-containing protein